MTGVSLELKLEFNILVDELANNCWRITIDDNQVIDVYAPNSETAIKKALSMKFA